MCFSAYACKWKVQHQNSSSLSKERTGWRGYLVRLEGQFLSILCELSLACLLPPASDLGSPPNLPYKRTGSSVSKWPWKVQTKALLNSIIWNAEILYEMLPSIAMATWCHPVTEQASQHLAETVLLPRWAKRWFWKRGPSWAKEHLQSKHFCSPLGEEKPLSLLLPDHGAGSKSHRQEMCAIKKGAWTEDKLLSVSIRLKAKREREKLGAQLCGPAGPQESGIRCRVAARGLSLGNASVAQLSHHTRWVKFRYI